MQVHIMHVHIMHIPIGKIRCFGLFFVPTLKHFICDDYMGLEI